MAVPTFSPPLAPSYSSGHHPQNIVERTPFHGGYEESLPRNIRGLNLGTFRWEATGSNVREYVESFHASLNGTNGPFLYRSFDKVPSPTGTEPTLTTVSGGALAERTYYVHFTWWHSTDGETLPSATASITVPINSFLMVQVPVVPNNVEGWRLYASETQGSEELQDTITTGRTWTQAAALSTGGASAPSTNTLNPVTKWFFVGELKKPRVAPDSWDLSIDVVEQLI